ncbi:hypothetical protein CYMTET_7306 [Cymbomonas tetramitiformis]|uniref:Uncharacterized protein n=1 Tax=Cymbomonas tetramitiformis TaxID=36881 RepID=A0AAE0LH56_9CHLO|nr:hypothetical protein CYMTET_7306 [Cymbomonas tetramitiformis]
MGSLNGTNIPCGCENPESSSYVTTKEWATVCTGCGYIDSTQLIMIHEVRTHTVVDEDNTGGFQSSLGCSRPEHSENGRAKFRRISLSGAQRKPNKDYARMKYAWYEDVELNEHFFGAAFARHLLPNMLNISKVIWASSIRDDQWLRGSQQFKDLGMDKFWEQMCALDERARVKSCFLSNGESEKYNLHVTQGLDRVDEEKEPDGSRWTWTDLLSRFFNCGDNKSLKQNRFLNVIRTVMRYRTLSNLAKLLNSDRVWSVPMLELVKLPCNEVDNEFFEDAIRQASVVELATQKFDALVRSPDATLAAPKTYDKRLMCVKEAWIELINHVNTSVENMHEQRTYSQLISLVYDGDSRHKVLLNDMFHLCDKYLIGMPHVLAKLVTVEKTVRPRKAVKKVRRTDVV